MARAYSLDLRERVVASVAAGQSCRAVAASFAVSVASVVKWLLRARATGSAAAKPMGGHRRFCWKSSGRGSWLARIAETPDLTLHALLDELRQRHVVGSCDTLWRFRIDPARLVFIDETTPESPSPSHRY